ncbi:coatomer subunit zeta-1 isoform X1 [Lingula anatina]|uniref:Coatomer subunit zeta n=1 Tax=Lingula anatina TaxID=7574 RepID=A0A2R2MRC6_LINAN|nr:coatomer subunit zeta-1 isoform X1 [Lingula anatina]|eukprot:XP_023932567.1 coatomer subunit zeta-1 isoform X1 [Lingula anatina]
MSNNQTLTPMKRNPLHVADKKMDIAMPEPSLYVIKAIGILDNDSNRIIAKYYDDHFPTVKEQIAFEKNLYNKTHRANDSVASRNWEDEFSAEIIMFEGLTCVYRSNVDLYFFVVGSSMENELILASVLNTFYESVSQMLRKNVEKRALLDNLDGAFLALDEICDGGIILEADSTAVCQRVAIKNDDIPLGEQTVAQVLQSAKEQLKWSLLK